VGSDVLEAETSAVMAKSSKPARRAAQSPAQGPEPKSFLKASRSQGPTTLTQGEADQVRAIQRAAEHNPRTYLEACRAEAR
jgi:hypothetical protein